MKVVIMAGGKGTRIAAINAEVPKPMIEICGKPILQHQIECLKEQGLTDITLVIGHLGNIVEDYFADGKDFGVTINYIREESPLGTAGALYYLKENVDDFFLLINGDIIFDVNIARFAEAHKKSNALVTILTHPNNHPYDSGVIVADSKGKVVQWLTKEEERLWYKNRVNAGLHMISRELLERFKEPVKIDLDRDILKPLIGEKGLCIYDSPEYVKDMGTPERYYSVTEDIKSGLVKKRNLSEKQKAIFLDRDGTINQYVGFLRDIDELKLMDGVSDAISTINKSGYLGIVITNQPVIARGEVSVEELEEIHKKMETLLGEKGAYIDDLFYCPHHPDKGFEGERPELKIKCQCRKPNPGMLIEAANKYNIDLQQSWMIGDGKNDIEAGKAAGCRTVLIGSCAENYGQDITVGSLREAVEMIMKEETNKEPRLEKRLEKHINLLIERYPKLEIIKENIISAYLLMEQCYLNGGKLLIAGNGGSAADSEHIAGELMKRFKIPRPVSAEFAQKLIEVDAVRGTELAKNLECSLMAIPLVAHESLSTAYINDVDGFGVFAQQLFGFGREGDVFLGISTSGNSKNIMNTTVVARALGMKVIGLTGEKGGELAKVADVSVKVPEIETYMIQELHLPIYHCWCLMLEDKFFGAEKRN